MQNDSAVLWQQADWTLQIFVVKSYRLTPHVSVTHNVSGSGDSCSPTLSAGQKSCARDIWSSNPENVGTHCLDS